MKNKNVDFPHPVLGIGDAVSPKPQLLPSPIRIENDHYAIHFDIEMKNDDILKLIRDEYATYVCEVDCPTTFKRFSIKSQEPYFDIILKKKDVAQRVFFDCTVTATKYIQGYTNSLAHPDYQGAVFNLEPGDLLAFIGKSHYDADIQYDKLQSAGSFMTIDKGSDESNTTYNLGKTKIVILLPPTLYDDYKMNFNGPGKHVDIIHSSLVFNALVYALLNYDEEEYGNTLWARTLKYRTELEPSLRQFSKVFENKDSRLILDFAQALLANPYKRLLNTMHEIIGQNTEQEGY